MFFFRQSQNSSQKPNPDNNVSENLPWLTRQQLVEKGFIPKPKTVLEVSFAYSNGSNARYTGILFKKIAGYVSDSEKTEGEKDKFVLYDKNNNALTTSFFVLPTTMNGRPLPSSATQNIEWQDQADHLSIFDRNGTLLLTTQIPTSVATVAPAAADIECVDASG